MEMEQIKWVPNRMPKSDDRQLSIMSLGNVAKARFFHSSFPQYSITPLARLDGMAKYQGLGDLFTVRTAGQLIDSAVIASLEYAVKKLHVSLICVLGHEHCGAIEAAEQELDALMHTITSEADGSLEAADAMDALDEHIAAAESIILRQAGMSVWQAREAELDAHEDIERVHVAHIIETLVEQSPVIQQALAADKRMIVGARYQLDSGKVEVLSF